jgi:hypothetical protein
MADENKKPTGLEKPAGAQAAADDPVIHVIPDKFYGAALKKKVKEMPIVTGVTPQGPPGAPPPGAVPPPKPKGKKRVFIIILGIVLLAAIGGVAWFLLRPKEPAAPPAPPPPPEPVCGDNKCESPKETPQNCSADCGPPPPVCGDNKCESPKETPQNCSADCGPPPPVCGDNRCEEPTETTENCPADCKPPEPKPALDTDSDGLSDREESEVFGSDANDPNTDNDSYVDLNEVLNLFDPARPTPALLRDNPQLAIYSNVTQSYVVYRPAIWGVREADAELREVFFNAPLGEFIEVLVEDKQEGQSLVDWYLAQSPGVTSSQIEIFTTKNGLSALLSPDRMTGYVDAGDRVIVVTYNIGSQLEIRYRVTHLMMVHSVRKLE